jgi:hypothetical protein
LEYVGGLAGKTIFVLFLLLIFVMGAWVAGVGFHDPDTCWLLALGRYICEHGALPATDPFSYTCASKPFVIYQWLTEVILFLTYTVSGLLGILCLVSLTVVTAFVLVPLRCFDGLGLSRLRTIGLITLGFTSAAFHLLVRPEIFSYLLLSIWLALFMRMRFQAFDDSSSINWRLVLAMAGLMVIWCNIHTGFTSAFIVLSIYTVANLFLLAARPKNSRFPLSMSLAVLATSFAATLVNPQGLSLWAYIPHLFFGSFNKHIVELAPLSLRDLTNWEFYPFFFLSLVAMRSWVRAGRSSSTAFADHASSAVLMAALMYFAASHHRLMSFSAVAIMYECAWLRSTMSVPATKSALALTEAKLRDLVKPDKAFVVLGAILALAGCLTVATGPVKPILPQPSKAFGYPRQAIEFMIEHPVTGRGFNSPQLGDVMIWRLVPPPKVFIDTRFDMYGSAIVDDYETIEYCKPGWKDRFDLYKFDWLFIHDKEPLARVMLESKEWKVMAKDEDSVYLRRTSLTLPELEHP